MSARAGARARPPKPPHVELRVGRLIKAQRTLGRPVLTRLVVQHALLLAAGIGVAPIRALAESLASDPGDVTVVYRVTDRSDASLLDEVERICRERNHALHVLDGPRPNGPGFLPRQQPGEQIAPEYARLLALAPFAAESDIYICGPSAWSNAAVQALKKLNVPKASIHVEEFAW